jgi:1,4-dihydroxy-2-naphthoyl-CoA hydrolase
VRSALDFERAEGFAVDGLVPFHHVDAAGIVFYARVFDWFHDVYVAFLASTGFPLPDAIRSGRWMAPLVHAEADYRSPLRFGDPLRMAIVDSETSAHRVSLAFRVTSGDRIAVTGSTVHVFVDPRTFARTPMPEALRAAFDRLS